MEDKLLISLNDVIDELQAKGLDTLADEVIEIKQCVLEHYAEMDDQVDTENYHRSIR
jgi:hypothetical protein